MNLRYKMPFIAMHYHLSSAWDTILSLLITVALVIYKIQILILIDENVNKQLTSET